jgi:hypothetical protein
MAGGMFNRGAEDAEQFSNSLSKVGEHAGLLTTAIGTLVGALHSLSVTWATSEIERTAQSFYKLRLSLGATQKDALKYVNTVKQMTSANVLSRRSLVDLYALNSLPHFRRSSRKQLENQQKLWQLWLMKAQTFN